MNVCKLIIKLKCISRLTFFIAYLIIGAVIFMNLEQNDEPNAVVAKSILTATRSRLSRRLGVNITDEDFLDAIENISKAVRLRGKPDWGFWKAFDFVFISLTTIGYGDIVPESETAQAVFIIYALIGLPIAMVTLKYTGIFLSKLINCLVAKIEKRFFGIQEPTRLNFKCFIVSLNVFILGHLVLGHAYAILCNVSYISGIYGVFVTMTTIGFGDYKLSLVHEDDTNELIPLLVLTRIVVILFTLTVVSCILNIPLEAEEFCVNTHVGQIKPNSNKIGEENEVKTNEEVHTSPPSIKA